MSYRDNNLMRDETVVYMMNGTGGGATPVPGIDNPLEFRRKAMQTIDDSEGAPALAAT